MFCNTSIKQFVRKSINQNMSLQRNNNEKYQPSYEYILRNFNVFSEVRSRLNISSVSASKHQPTDFHLIQHISKRGSNIYFVDVRQCISNYKKYKSFKDFCLSKVRVLVNSVTEKKLSFSNLWSIIERRGLLVSNSVGLGSNIGLEVGYQEVNSTSKNSRST